MAWCSIVKQGTTLSLPLPLSQSNMEREADHSEDGCEVRIGLSLTCGGQK